MEPNGSSDEATDDASRINRRTVLTGTAGAAGFLTFGLGSAAAKRNGNGPPDDAGNGNGPPDDAGNPQEDCGCDGVSGKYDFNGCRFELTEGEDVVTITYDSDDPDQNKDGEKCEPIEVDYEANDSYGVTKICAFGGTANDTEEEDPAAEDGTYESDLTNPGGQQAAISNITFCVEERDEKEDIDAVQVDLIHGNTILEDPCNAKQTYSQQERLVQSLWGWKEDGSFKHRFEGQFDDDSSEYGDCWDPSTQDEAIKHKLHFGPENDVARVTINTDLVGDCDVDDFSLVSYKSENNPKDGEDPGFDNCVTQSVFNKDLDGDSSSGEFEVDIPVDQLSD